MLVTHGPDQGFFDADAGDVEDFRALISQSLDPALVPLAARVDKNIPVYDMATLRPALDDPDQRRDLLTEWSWVLRRSAGVIVLKSAYGDTAPIDRATDVFNTIIAEEKDGCAGKGDHFAASGANDRVWNSLQKQCLRDPEGFALYYGNPVLAAAAEAWLGPDYQMTAQVNLVHPGGQAQQVHRDYHLGFFGPETCARFPIHVHDLTAALTLQGGIAHVDMSVASGPTKLLPFSQMYGPGYIAFHDPGHRAVFEENYVQMPLRKGDAVFFSPALFHAAGENRSVDVARMVNLLQVSSAFGRALEAVDRSAMAQTLFPVLARLVQDAGLNAVQADAAIAACAEAYPFPTNLDTDPPLGGNAPASQAALMRAALARGATSAEFTAELAALAQRQKP